MKKVGIIGGGAILAGAGVGSGLGSLQIIASLATLGI